jgi:DNA-3-methyladenine glycosylase
MSKLIRLKEKFYQQNTFKLAKALLGKFLVRKIGTKMLIGKIVEVEAYYGLQDRASHTSRGKTERTKLMFDKPGLAYIYLVYGMYNCLNIVTEKKDFPAAILIRSLEPYYCHPSTKLRVTKHFCHGEHSRTMTLTTNGPGKLCKTFKIDRKLNGENLITSKKLYLAQSPKEKIKKSRIISAKRIGIDYAGKYKHKLWRFYLKDNEFVSQK